MDAAHVEDAFVWVEAVALIDEAYFDCSGHFCFFLLHSFDCRTTCGARVHQKQPLIIDTRRQGEGGTLTTGRHILPGIYEFAISSLGAFPMPITTKL